MNNETRKLWGVHGGVMFVLIIVLFVNLIPWGV